MPDSWSDNRSCGVSSAFYSSTQRIVVTARYYTPENAEISLDDHVFSEIEEYAKTYEQFDLEANEPAVLGGADAKELIYCINHEGDTFKFRQLFAKYLGDIVVLTFYAPTDFYDGMIEIFDEIIDEFVLREQGDVVNDCVTDKKTPEGMKIASSDNVEYRLYVPVSWICNSQSGKAEAYYPESGRPNVTLTSYSPENAMTAEEYFAECEVEYKKSIDGYEFISVSDRTVGGRDCKQYTYSVCIGGVSIRIMQAIFVYNDMVYSFTYTALEDAFELHLEDVDDMLDAFIFR